VVETVFRIKQHQCGLLWATLKPTLLVVSLLFAGSFVKTLHAADARKAPNFVIINCDNLGYGDVGCFGSKKHRTPHIDQMAAEGMRLTSFYSASAVCTPSRAALMTGCYPRRVNMHVGDNNGIVLFPVSRKGLHPDEVTIAEVLQTRGYATICIGKWHLGRKLAGPQAQTPLNCASAPARRGGVPEQFRPSSCMLHS
jgi:arylsulfatase A-like enzyme